MKNLKDFYVVEIPESKYVAGEYNLLGTDKKLTEQEIKNFISLKEYLQELEK